MQSWSWTAALTLGLALVGAHSPEAVADEPAPAKQKVALSLKFDGLSAQGGEIEIKPGNAGCKFETMKFQTKGHPRTDSSGRINLDPFEIETQSADRNCSFSITLKEPGQPDKTVRRTLRITPSPEGKSPVPQSLTCFISSNSLSPVVTTSKPDDSKTKK